MSAADIYTVSRLNSEVRLTLELQFRQLWLVGEISNFTAASSGHWYFSLKDQAAQVKVAMFKMANRNAGFTPRNGQQVLIRARISVYEPRGEYQLLADFIEASGDGLLRQHYEQRKAQFMAEGLFDASRKQALPRQIRRVGIITSPTGAAVRDIITVCARRAPHLELIVYPSLVQGDMAAADLCAALQLAYRRRECDVLIIGRGGGSLEDLWCFNDEALIRLLAQRPMPVISAVGHEVDFTLCDFVADIRAATPSAAAELVSPDQQEQREQLKQLQQRLLLSMQRHTQSLRRQLQQHLQRLHQQHPQRRLEQQQQRLDEIQHRLQQAMLRRLQQLQRQLHWQHDALQSRSPQRRLQQQQHQLAFVQQRLVSAITRQLQQRRQQWQLQSQQLHNFSPLATLDRGYSLVFDVKGQLVKQACDVTAGEDIQIKLSQGQLSAKVISTTSKA